MSEELKNIEVPKIEVTPNTEIDSESLDFSKKIEISAESQKVDRVQEVQQPQVVTNTTQTVTTNIGGELVGEIEKILESDLKDLYMSMSKEKQQEFRVKGEETANKISVLLKEVKVQVNKILKLIIDWLSIIPGINKVFLKQAAKIKTDKIIAMKDKQIELSSKK